MKRIVAGLTRFLERACHAPHGRALLAYLEDAGGALGYECVDMIAGDVAVYRVVYP